MKAVCAVSGKDLQTTSFNDIAVNKKGTNLCVW